MPHKKILLALAASAILAGCVVTPAGRPHYGGPVIVAPPPPRVEYAPAPPVVGHIWVGGYWNWVGQRHEWVPGHWREPRPGYVWTPHRWENHGDHWRQHEGRWEEEHARRDRREWR